MEQIKKKFDLLKRIVNSEDTVGEKLDLSDLESFIFTELPNELKDCAPENFPELYYEFQYEYERFKSFILYDKLIGKNIVALGGGFSTGKSSFLNAIMEQSILPSNILASTSVPTYLVQDEQTLAYGINTFGSKVEMELEDVKTIAHGFGKIDESDKNDKEATLGHIIDSIFVMLPEQKFHNIALLDTPGYSQGDTMDYSAKTDEKIARAQLNSSNFIMWFIQADKGTIPKGDIVFLETLRKDIPKLIIVNKADKVLEKDLEDIVENIKNILDVKGIQYIDVLAFSRRKGSVYDRDKIIKQLEKWDQEKFENRFAYNFKVLFTRCKEYYDTKIDEEGKRLNRLNKAVTLSENDVITECLNSLIGEIKRSITTLKEKKEKLKELQNRFFAEIKRIGDVVHIEMPEPSEIDLIQDKIVNPKEVLEQYCEKHNIKQNPEISILLNDIFAEVNSVFLKVEGNGEYSKELEEIITSTMNIDKKRIKFKYS